MTGCKRGSTENQSESYYGSNDAGHDLGFESTFRRGSSQGATTNGTYEHALCREGLIQSGHKQAAEPVPKGTDGVLKAFRAGSGEAIAANPRQTTPSRWRREAHTPVPHPRCP